MSACFRLEFASQFFLREEIREMGMEGEGSRASLPSFLPVAHHSVSHSLGGKGGGRETTVSSGGPFFPSIHFIIDASILYSFGNLVPEFKSVLIYRLVLVASAASN
mmetsp:Transcript_26287/g.51622  ORF Transcript_26287/g.51622 Transcript_26287/m.51622 type:complete len:106 (+) Transcript_26287:258-575(+)